MTQEKWDVDVVFPEKWRKTIDRAIRYVDFISRKVGHPPLPLKYYNLYNSPGVRKILQNNRSKLDVPVLLFLSTIR